MPELNNDMAANAAARCRQSTAPFLKQRYAFQALRLWYYSGTLASPEDTLVAMAQERGDSIGFYAQKYLQGGSILCGWTNLYVGMSRRNDTERAYYLVRAFDESDEKKVFAFQHLSKKDLEMVARSRYAPEIGDALIAIQCMKNMGRMLPQLADLQRRHPRSKYLPTLIAREINKLEGWLWTPDILRFIPPDKTFWNWSDHSGKLPDGTTVDTTYAFYAAKNYRKDRLYLKVVRAFVAGLANRPSPQQPFMALAAAHLCNMERDYSSARRYVRLAARGIRASDTARCLQRAMEEAIADAYRPDIRSIAAKARLARDVAKLQAYGLKQCTNRREFWEYDGDPAPKDETALSQYYLLLSRRYQQAGDVLTASLLFNQSCTVSNEYGSTSQRWRDPADTVVHYSAIAYLDRNGTIHDVDAMLAFLHKKRKTPFEQLLMPARAMPDDFYRDLKGTMLFREKRYVEASAVFHRMAPDFWAHAFEYGAYLPRTPIWDLGTLMPRPPKAVKRYAEPDKAAITDDIIYLQKTLNAGAGAGARAQAAFNLASAQYQTSYWGKAWMMFSYGKSLRELNNYGEEQENWAWFTFYPTGDRYRGRYYRCSDAISTYQYAQRQAMIAHDSETAAKSALMLAVCDMAAEQDRRLRHLYRVGFPFYYRQETTAYTSPCMRTFVAQFKNTQTFAHASTDCPDVAEYLLPPH